MGGQRYASFGSHGRATGAGSMRTFEPLSRKMRTRSASRCWAVSVGSLRDVGCSTLAPRVTMGAVGLPGPRRPLALGALAAEQPAQAAGEEGTAAPQLGQLV